MIASRPPGPRGPALCHLPSHRRHHVVLEGETHDPAGAHNDQSCASGGHSPAILRSSRSADSARRHQEHFVSSAAQATMCLYARLPDYGRTRMPRNGRLPRRLIRPRVAAESVAGASPGTIRVPSGFSTGISASPQGSVTGPRMTVSPAAVSGACSAQTSRAGIQTPPVIGRVGCEAQRLHRGRRRRRPPGRPPPRFRRGW